MNKNYKILRIGNLSLIGIINSFVYTEAGNDGRAFLFLFIILYISDQISVKDSA